MSDVKFLICKFDIFFCLQETWLTDSHSLTIDGYNIHRNDRKNNRNKKRGSGGVVTLYKVHLAKGISKIKSKSQDLMWLKLDKVYFQQENDIYICNCYIPPENSKFSKETSEAPFEILRTELETYGADGNRIIMGNFNSRTGEIQASLHNDMTHPSFNLPDMTLETHIPLRSNKDKKVNKFGK